MFKKIVRMFVFTSIVYSAVSCNSDEKPDNVIPLFRKNNWNGKKELFPSQDIPIELATEMRSYYKKTIKTMKTIYLLNGEPKIDTMEGYVFNAKDLESLIMDANGKKAKDVIIYFGRDPKDIVDPNTGKTYPSLALIAMSIDSSGKLGQKAFDKADPCPPSCP